VAASLRRLMNGDGVVIVEYSDRLLGQHAG
jgi:hypothetical protein